VNKRIEKRIIFNTQKLINPLKPKNLRLGLFNEILNFLQYNIRINIYIEVYYFIRIYDILYTYFL